MDTDEIKDPSSEEDSDPAVKECPITLNVEGFPAYHLTYLDSGSDEEEEEESHSDSDSDEDEESEDFVDDDEELGFEDHRPSFLCVICDSKKAMPNESYCRSCVSWCIACSIIQPTEQMYKVGKNTLCRKCVRLSPCVVCSDKQPPSHMIKLSDCTHLFCQSCFDKSAWGIIQADIFRPKCPDTNCKAVFLFDRTPPELFCRWSNALAEARDSDHVSLQCIFGQCKKVFLSSDRKSLACPDCAARFCLSCYKTRHEGLTCEENKAAEEAQISLLFDEYLQRDR